ncbi:MAG: (d)CMP kinase [Actinobacteria bacterium]|nr:(d)CMP kinase [Actinomycetota bacterium]
MDGPAGSGKSTVARAVAGSLGLPYLDTGAMYRSVAWAALRAGVDLRDAAAVAAVAAALDIDVGDTVCVDGIDVTDAIRNQDVNTAVSIVSAHAEVRAELVKRQRDWAAGNGGSGVVEGRDIGSVVFPNATVKVFLIADETVRAARRGEEADIARRDRLDTRRAVSPLTKAEGAVEVDTTATAVDDVVARVLALVPE